MHFDTFDNRCDVLRAAFCDSQDVLLRGCMIFLVERLRDFFVERLHDFVYGEVAWFCVWRGCVIFFTHSLRLHDILRRGCITFFWRELAWLFSLTQSIRLHDLFFWRLRDFFSGEVAWFFVERLHVFLCEKVVWFLFCVKRLRDFFVKMLHDFLCEGVFSHFFSGENSFLIKQKKIGHYCHYCL